MATGKPTTRQWTLKGIPEETRQAARQAAERRGQPMNRWLNDVILKAAQEEAEGQLPVPQEDAVRQLAVRLEEVAGEVRAIRERQEVGLMIAVRRAWRGLLVRLTPPP